MSEQQYTDEQIKAAEEAISDAKQRGFIQHLHANDKSAAEIEKLHGRYVEDDAKRTAHMEGLHSAILGEEAS